MSKPGPVFAKEDEGYPFAPFGIPNDMLVGFTIKMKPYLGYDSTQNVYISQHRGKISNIPGLQRETIKHNRHYGGKLYKIPSNTNTAINIVTIVPILVGTCDLESLGGLRPRI